MEIDGRQEEGRGMERETETNSEWERGSKGKRLLVPDENASHSWSALLLFSVSRSKLPQIEQTLPSSDSIVNFLQLLQDF
ncbi:hypothetical protein CRG98_016092 [Punica granatum]|uniref:Uncharacterized protein n=1 Tax=Punica granatum TaxID=22663 RepID=A0A2I0K4F2_PUNGR|nr:hypothetical protein CRG98_016092 [Punica granatum]